MAGINPWDYAAKSRTEHAEQAALFMWAGVAERFGPNIANDPHSYTVPGFALKQFEGKGGLGYIRYTPPLPQLKWLHAIHNQGHGDAIRGNRAKAEGTKAGVADTFLPVPSWLNLHGLSRPAAPSHYGLYLELKRKDSGSPSAIQLDFQTDMRAAGYMAEICHGWELARDCILSYLSLAN